MLTFKECPKQLSVSHVGSYLMIFFSSGTDWGPTGGLIPRQRVSVYYAAIVYYSKEKSCPCCNCLLLKIENEDKSRLAVKWNSTISLLHSCGRIPRHEIKRKLCNSFDSGNSTTDDMIKCKKKVKASIGEVVQKLIIQHNEAENPFYYFKCYPFKHAVHPLVVNRHVLRKQVFL